MVKILCLKYHVITGIAETEEDQWNKLWVRFLAETDPQEKVRLRSALCATKSESIVNRYEHYPPLQTNKIIKLIMYKA